MSIAHSLRLTGLALLSLIGLMAQTVTTSVPRLVRVEGSVPSTASSAIADDEVTLAIYAAQSGGNALWKESQKVTLGHDGRYSLLLGATQNDGIPAELFVSGEERWLGVQFQRSGEPEQPRTLLASVPYALKAANADTLGGLPAAAYLLNPSYPAATAPGAVKSATVLPRVTSNGVANWIAAFSDNTGDLAQSVLYQNGGKIGLGTTNPLDYFHVSFSDNTGGFTGYAVQNLSGGMNAYSGMLFYDQNTALGQFQGFNNSTHEYRINNIAKTSGTIDGSINFMIGGQSAFKVRSDLDVDIPNSIRRSGQMFINTIGSQNTSVGLSALTGTFQSFTANFNNTAVGYNAGKANNQGSDNTIMGAQALMTNTNGNQNTAIGSNALSSLQSSDGNTAVGFQALNKLVAGTGNTALGYTAGSNIVNGSNNILIGNLGTAADNSTIRIGTPGTHLSTFLAGVNGVTVTNPVPVYVDSNGHLGTIQSSRRYKEDIQDMNDSSGNLYRLRPVTYRYKQAYPDGSKPIEYGLIAEEVAQVYPDLVVRNNDGEIQTVQYQKLTPMMLNEVQREHSTIQSLEEEVAALRKIIADLTAASRAASEPKR